MARAIPPYGRHTLRTEPIPVGDLIGTILELGSIEAATHYQISKSSLYKYLHRHGIRFEMTVVIDKQRPGAA
jgi:hypothetical protein